VRDEFRAAVEPLIAEHLDSVHVEDLARQWHLVLRPDGLERAGQAVRDPLRFKGSSTVIATFDEGRFTLGDLVRWLRAVPDWMHTQVERGTARELAGFLRMMMGYELLYHEALNNGIWISPSEFAELKQELARRLDQVKVAVGVYPPAPGDSTSVAERERRAAERIDRFLETLRENWGRFARVPPLLTERLQDQWGGTVYPRGVARALGHALAQRPRGDSTDAATR
jgi:hypothetical protein